MEIQGPGSVSGPDPIQPNNRLRAAYQAAPAERASDSVEISEIARLKAMLEKVPEIRLERVAELRAQIEAGTYETEEKLEGMIDGLLREID